MKLGHGASFNSISPVSSSDMEKWANLNNISDASVFPIPTNMTFQESVLKAKKDRWLPPGFSRRDNIAIAFPPSTSGHHYLSMFLNMGGHLLFNSLWIVRGKDCFNLSLPSESCYCFCETLIPKGTRYNLINQNQVDVRPDHCLSGILLIRNSFDL